MTTPSLASLLIQETKEAIYAAALAVATSIGVPVSSWQPGDPTRSLYFVEAEQLSTLETVVVGYISAGFLDYATGPWLKILAKQVYNVDVPDATYATTDLVLTNGGGGVYDIAAGDLTFKSSLSGKTYHNTTGGTLASGPATTLTVTVVADEAGSGSSAGATEIDTFVTTLLGVTCSNSVAAVGLDEQDEATTRQQCRDKLGSLSPNGPKDAYSYVARNSTLTGVTSVNRVRVYPDSDTGDVTIYVAGPSGAISGPDLTAVTDAIATYATPLCITPTVSNASNVSVAVTYTLWLYKSVNKTSAQVQSDVAAALEKMFASATLNPIGGNIIPPSATGALHKSLIESTIRGTFTQAFKVTVSVPASDTALTNGQVATLGTVTPTINFINDP